jgi:integrase
MTDETAGREAPEAPVPASEADGSGPPSAPTADAAGADGGAVPGTDIAFGALAAASRYDAEILRKGVELARDALAPRTRAAYRYDWRHFEAWARRHGRPTAPPCPETVANHLTELAWPTPDARGRAAAPAALASIERRLAGIAWVCRMRGTPLDRDHRVLRAVMDGIRRRLAAPPRQKAPLSPEDVRAMCTTLGMRSRRALRDRAILLLGYAGALRRSEIVGLDAARDTGDGDGWIEIDPGGEGLLLRFRSKTGLRELAVDRGRWRRTCPLHAVELWMRFGRIEGGPLFRRISPRGDRVQPARLSAEAVAELVKRSADAAGLRPDVTGPARRALFSGHSLRAGFASYAALDERHIQRQLGHASVDTTRLYQRRAERFGAAATKSLGF